MSYQPIIVVNVLQAVVTAVNNQLYPPPAKQVRFINGRSIQILNQLQRLRNAAATKDTVYPLVALFQDFPEQTGKGYDLVVKFPKILIACLTNENDDPDVRYTKTFEPILYPIYGEFLRQLAKHPNVVGNDPRAFTSVVWERPGSQPVGGNLNDFIDAIELQNLEVTFWQNKHC